MCKKINVLMITGVYLPEFNGAILQCRNLILNTKDQVNYSILTGTHFNKNKQQINIDDIPVNDCVASSN